MSNRNTDHSYQVLRQKPRQSRFDPRSSDTASTAGPVKGTVLFRRRLTMVAVHTFKSFLLMLVTFVAVTIGSAKEVEAGWKLVAYNDGRGDDGVHRSALRWFAVDIEQAGVGAAGQSAPGSSSDETLGSSSDETPGSSSDETPGGTKEVTDSANCFVTTAAQLPEDAPLLSLGSDGRRLLWAGLIVLLVSYVFCYMRRSLYSKRIRSPFLFAHQD